MPGTQDGEAMNAFYFCLIAGALYLPALFIQHILKDLREVGIFKDKKASA